MKVLHPWHLKKSKSWGPFWSYHLDSSANLAHLPQKWVKWAELAVVILIFSIAMGADYLFDVKNIDIWAPTFFRHNNSFIATVLY